MADIRESSVKLLTTALNKTGTANDDRASTIAQEIEEEVYQAHQGNTGNPYRNQLRSIHLDLSKNNVELANQLISGDLSAQELVGLGSEGMKTNERARQDDELRQQGLRESIGTHKIPVGESAGNSASPTEANDLGQEGRIGRQEASIGEEGDFKQRAQPKIQSLEGIEFESGL